MITAGGVVFIGAALDRRLHAYDVETGRELWQGVLPESAKATPMSYRLASGAQYRGDCGRGRRCLGRRRFRGGLSSAPVIGPASANMLALAIYAARAAHPKAGTYAAALFPRALARVEGVSSMLQGLQPPSCLLVAWIEQLLYRLQVTEA